MSETRHKLMNKYAKILNYNGLSPDLIEYIRQHWDSDIKKGILMILSDDEYDYVKPNEYISMINYIKKYVDCSKYVNNIFRYVRYDDNFKLPIYNWVYYNINHQFIYEWYDVLDIDIKKKIAFYSGNIYYLLRYMTDNNKYDDFKLTIYYTDYKSLCISIHNNTEPHPCDYLLSRIELYSLINIKKPINIKCSEKDHNNNYIINNYIINTGLATQIMEFQRKYMI